MRDPVPRIDPKSEAAIEDTCRYLERYIQAESWRADPDGFASDLRATIDEIERSDLEEWAKNFAIFALLERTKKRRGKPTQRYRDRAIQEAAIRLVMRGYKPTRNEATLRDSASSIIHQALRGLGETLQEKSINAIVGKIPASSFIKHKVSPAFIEWVREQAPDFIDLFESDPSAPDPVDLSGRPVVLK
jgi:hypothetical protein